MKYIRNFNESINRSDIDAICEKYNIKNYIINEDGTIDVNGNVDLHNKQLTILPLKFRNVSGYFDCSSNKLTSLEGAPQNVGGGFYCSGNRLTNLIGSPQIVNEFLCHENQLTSLEGCPKKVYGYFSCRNNKLKNIDYLPKYYKKMRIFNNPIYKILNLFTKCNEYGWIYNTKENKELISEFIDREIIQQDILLVNRLVEFLDDIDKPKSREELIELLKNDYEIR